MGRGDCIMSERKLELKRKIHNVKEWLDSADSSFEHDQELKGQLNLMLAQAEMQTLKKTNGKWYRRYRKHIVIGILILVLTSGIVYNLFTKEQKVDTIIRSNFQTLDVKTKTTVPQPFQPEEVDGKILNSGAGAQPLPEKKETVQTLTETEKRNLIRQAQQSLHGELKR